MKLLFVVTEDWYFVSHRLALANAAIKAGFDVAVATRVQQHGAEIERAGIRLIPIKLSRRSRNPFRELGSIIELASIYNKEQPDIVHHVAMKPVLYGSLAAWLMGVGGVVNAIAGLGYVFVSTSRIAALFRFIIKIAFRLLFSRKNTRVIIQNPDDYAFLQHELNIKSSNLFLIRGSGVNLQAFPARQQPSGVPIIVLPARMLKDKGVAEFVEAARLLRESRVAARFILVGDEDAANPAAINNAQLQQWQLNGIVEWWGRRDDMANIYAQSHIVCLPSYREGLPKVLLEAAASSRAIVSTDVPGCREIVGDGVNGLLVSTHDSKSLADALEKLIINADLRKKMGEAGRKIVEQEFSDEKVIAATIDVYQILIDRVIKP